jgi:hypothetical protein
MEATWAYVVFPLLGAGGGAAAGYALLDNKGNVEAAIGALAFGMAMIVPTMVLTISATTYDPEDEPTVLRPGDEESRARALELARAGSGIFRLSERGLYLGLPGASLSLTSRSSATSGLELSVPVFTGVF